MSRCATCGCQVESPFDGKTVIHDVTRCGSLAAPSGSAKRASREGQSAFRLAMLVLQGNTASDPDTRDAIADVLSWAAPWSSPNAPGEPPARENQKL